MASVVVASAGLAGVVVGVFLVRCGIRRKHILIASGIGTSLAFIALGVNFHGGKWNYFLDL